MIMPIGQAILAQAAGPQRMGRIMSVIGVPTLLGPILGPVIGGLIVDNASWRWIFFVSVPVGIVALALAARVLPGVEAGGSRARLDVRGLLLLSPGLAVLIYGLSEVGIEGGLESARVVVSLVAGVVLLSLFVRHALRGGDTLIDLRLFRDRRSPRASGTVFIFGVSLFGAMLILPLYYQVVRGESALGAGLLLAPQGSARRWRCRWPASWTDRLGAGRIVPRRDPRVARHGRVHAARARHPVHAAGVRAVAARGRARDDDDAGDGGRLSDALARRGAAGDHRPEHHPHDRRLVRHRVPVGGVERRIEANLPHVGGALGSLRGVPGGGPPPPVIAEPLAHAFGQTFWWALGLTALALIPASFLRVTRRCRSAPPGRRRPRRSPPHRRVGRERLPCGLRITGGRSTQFIRQEVPVRNPVRSEADAFHIVFGSAAVIGASVVLGALTVPLAGVALFAGAIAGALIWELRTTDPDRRRPLREAAAQGDRFARHGRRRVLVVANRTLPGAELRAELLRRAADGAELRIVTPILTSRVHYIASDIDSELREARSRLSEALDWARAEGPEQGARRDAVRDDPRLVVRLRDLVQREALDAREVLLLETRPAHSVREKRHRRALARGLDIPVTTSSSTSRSPRRPRPDARPRRGAARPYEDERARFSGPPPVPEPSDGVSSGSAGWACSWFLTASWSCSRPMMRTLERKLPSRPCCSTSPRPPPPPPPS
jgi:MFS family permease